MTDAPRGLGVYRDVLAVPGAPGFVVCGVLARLPISMLGIGIVLLVEGAYGSYTLAGAVTGVYVVVAAVAGPVLSRAVDRAGQAAVMRPVIAVHVAGIGALLALVDARAPLWALLGAVTVMGLSSGSFGSLVRARWLHVLHRDAGPAPAGGGPRLEARVHTAFALESVLDEVVFVAGPLIVTVLGTAISPVLGLVAAAAAVGVGGAALLAQRATEPAPTPGVAEVGSGVLRSRGVLLLMLVFVAAGSVFGGVEIVTVAFTKSRGVPAAAAWVLGAYAVGSLLAGVAYGALNGSGQAGRRFFVAALLFAAGMLPLALVSSVSGLAVVLFVAGFAVSPTLIAGNALVRQLVAPARLTEGLTWVGTSLGMGVAVGAAVGGRWVDAAGAQSALLLPVVCGAVVALVALAGRRRLSASPPTR